jgi:general secretion pathway protein M
MAIFGFVVIPICDFFADRNSRIAEQRVLLARLEAIAAQDANVQSMARRPDAQLQRGEFLIGPNEGVINADLQTRLKALTQAGGARLRSAQSLPAKANDQIRYSGSRIDIYGSLQSIQKTIYAIESATPYLFVTGAVIKLSLPSNRPGVVEEPVIQAQLDIVGPMHIEGRDQ